MKRLFHRRASSGSSVPSSTPASPADTAPPAAIRSNTSSNASPSVGSAAAAAFPASPPLTLPLPTAPAVPRSQGSSPTKIQPVCIAHVLSADELRAATRAFLDTSSSKVVRRQALQTLHSALVSTHTHQEASTCAKSNTTIFEQDRRSLLAACAQRTQRQLSKCLENYNSGKMQGDASQRFSMAQEDALECGLMLAMLGSLLAGREHAVVLTSERLPSTLVKLLKALAGSSAASESDAPSRAAAERELQELGDCTLVFLGAAIAYDNVVQELMDSSTLHRLFYLSFQHARERQLATISVLEELVRSRSRDAWLKKLVPHFVEHKCLAGLLEAVADDAHILAKVLSLLSCILRHAAASGSTALHEQARAVQLYGRLMALFAKIFESGQAQLSLGQLSLSLPSSNSGESSVAREQEAIVLALSDLVLSGSENGKTHTDVATQKYFALLHGDLATQPQTIARSLFNSDAFRLLSDVLEYLHIPTPVEQQSARGGSTALAALQQQHREQLECKYMERIGRILCLNRYDYVRVMQTQVLAHMIVRLDEYPDVTKTTVGSVLSAIAIEARVIPYAELVAANQVLSKGYRGTSSVSVLLGCLLNLLRFHDAYVQILRSVGVLESLMALFQSQVLSVVVESPRVAIAYPTSAMKLGTLAYATAEYLPVTESSLHALLESHCGCAPSPSSSSPSSSPSSVLNSEQSVMAARDFAVVMDVLTVFAGGALQQRSSSKDASDDNYYAQTLCSPSTLECVCVLVTNELFQEPALALWSQILHIALTYTREATGVLNSVNCMMQAIRCVTLSLGLEPREREQVLAALIDCDAVNSCLAVLSAIADLKPQSGSNECARNLLRVACLAMRLIHVQIVHSQVAGRAFARTATFGLYGDLLHRLVKLGLGHSATLETSAVEARGDSDCSDRAFLLWTLQALLGVSVGDFAVEQLDAWQQQQSGICKPNADQMESRKRAVVHAGALALALQLCSLWCHVLRQEEVSGILEFCIAVSNDPGNAQQLASSGLIDVILRAYGATSRLTAVSEQDRGASLPAALLSEQNVFHRQVVRLLGAIAPLGMSYHEISLWIQLILNLSGMRGQSTGTQLFEQAALTSTECQSEHESSRTVQLAARESSLSPALLRLFVELSSPATARSVPTVPGVRFDVSTDGFAYLQIPEVHARSVVSSAGSASSSSAPSIPSFSSVQRIWPPADGYSVLLWFRIDALETKDEREKLYRECFMARKCCLCGGVLRDETVLKCSHRACRPCIDALLLCGGECVICNAPMFYLFRFRSGDAKSVSEAFLRGTRVFMRTSATRTVHQFSHAPIEANRWHHAAFVHSRQRFQSSTVSFYLNGVLQETVKVSYPSSITSGQPLSGMVGIPSQARRISSSAWTVGSFYLIDEPVAAFGINAVFAAGPRYDGLFAGSTSTGEIPACFDHLRVQNLALIDEYMRDPIRALIESVDAERVSKNSFLRGSLSLASAASAAAAAIVQDIKSDASVFARIPSAVPLLNVPIHQDHVLLAYTSRNAAEDASSIIPSSRLDGRPIAQLMGGTAAFAPVAIGDVLYELCGSGCQVVYVLLARASTTTDVELSLRLLWRVMQGNAQNLDAMEQEHGYGIVNYLLHQKASLLGNSTLRLLFQMVGIDINDDDGDDDSDEHAENRSGSNSQSLGISMSPPRESSIRNLMALQYFVLDYSLWQKVDTETQKLLFSSLYSCLVAGDDALRDRNRSQLQSLSVVRQLLYVFLDPHVEPDLLRVIVDLILVCLTGAGPRDASLEGNFADVAAFLTSTLSPKFVQSSSSKEPNEPSSGHVRVVPSEHLHRAGNTLTGAFAFESPVCSLLSAESAIATLCLSPRGGKHQRRTLRFFADGGKTLMSARARFALADTDDDASHSSSRSAKWRARQVKVQDLLLDILLKAVQKHDLKESKDRDDTDGTVVTSNGGSAGSAAATTTVVSGSSGGTSALATASRIQLPSSHRLTGFRKVLSPRWMSYFLFPLAAPVVCAPIAPTTVILALKLLCALLSRPRYEAHFKKEGCYRLLTQGLPCSECAFEGSSKSKPSGAVASQQATAAAGAAFPFGEMWYTLFCVLLGTPVDGIPHRIEFEMFYLTKDFELNIESDRILNANVVMVILGVVRRHYDDPVAMAGLQHSARDGGAQQFRYRDAHRQSTLGPTGAASHEHVCHAQVLAFLHHIYTKMPSLHRLLAASGSDKLRMELLEELVLLICAASRRRVMEQYAPSEKRVYRTLLNEKRDLSAYEAAICAVALAEDAAAKDTAGHDPFSHTTAVAALRLLVDVLLNFLLDSPKGTDIVEAFLDDALGADLSPPLHDGLAVHFHALVVRGLVAQIRDRFNDEAVLTDHKLFAANLRDFLRLAVQKMHTWQRAQHGDGCPPPLACCSSVYFAGGPAKLLELVLFVLAETSVGIVGGGGGGGSGFSIFSSSSTSLGGMLQEKLTKGKKRRQIRQIIGRMSLSKPVELESLLESLYVTLNAVVLHMLRGHRAEMSDAELARMLQLIHVNRDVVLGSRNSQDKNFFVCLCRYLLQLVRDASPVLQEAAVHVWVDLLYFQRALMVDLLTIEIRHAGAPPYSVNLMKNGFDVLLECPSTDVTDSDLDDSRSGGADSVAGDPSTRAIRSPAFTKFTKWLDLVGPPLKELEITLDRTFLKSVVDAKESVRDAWATHHRKLTARASKLARRATSRHEWFVEMDKAQLYSLVEVQQKEFRRQVKWRQDRIDGQKFIAREWQHIQLHALQHALGGGVTTADAKSTAMSNPSLMHAFAASSAPVSAASADAHGIANVWRLDFTEGPFRMRKRFLRMSHQCLDVSTDSVELCQFERGSSRATSGGVADSVGGGQISWATGETLPAHTTHLKLRQRRFSEGDLPAFALAKDDSRALVDRAPRFVARESNVDGLTQLLDSSHSTRDATFHECQRRGSFQDVRYTKVLDDTSSIQSSYSIDRRRDSQDSSAGIADNDGDEGERSGTFIGGGGDSSGGVLQQQQEEDAVDEKLRPLLMPDDEITDIYDCLRIDGMDSRPGVFLLCNDHAYIVDNYQRLVTQQHELGGLDAVMHGGRSQTRVVEISRGSTTRLERGLSLRHRTSHGEGTTGDWGHAINSHMPSNSDTSSSFRFLSRPSLTHQCRFWSYDDIVELHKRRYQLRHVAIEIFAHDGRNYLITFESHQQRESVFHSLLNRCPNVRGAANGMDRSAVSGDLYSQLRKLLRNSMTERWIGGEISNFEYLMHLNTLAGRSYNDLTQYPVFPWVLSNYSSEVIDLNDPGVFRDLTKPMGALNREEEFRARYEGLSENPDASDLLTAKPFHYGTHYSSAAIVLYYLMRVEPFTTHLVHLQGGKYDHADRLFSSLLGAWNSAAGIENAQNGTQDVKELIPEFFYLPAFLENRNGFDFGRDQNGTQVDAVQLPPWAHGSAKEFVRVNREALESSFVSAHLHHWIDLIFGVKQQGAAAVDACNVFYHLTYEGAVDLDAISDPAMKRAIVDQINEFGQTPSQLFKTPHPAKTRITPSSSGAALSNTSSLASVGAHSLGPSSESRGLHASSSASDHAAALLPTSSTGSGVSYAAASPLTSRGALTSSFIGVMESSELMNRMQTILSNTGLGSGADDATRILDEAALLHQEPKREVSMNPLVVAYRGHQHTTPGAAPVRTRQLSSGVFAASIQQIAMTTGSVAREERVAAVSDRCLLIPPRNHEFLAWGFQDRSIKVLSAGSCELDSGGDSKVLASFEVTVEVHVACITSDGRTVVTGGASSPVIRIWEFSTKKSALSSIGASRRRAYTMSLPTVGQSARSLTPLATLVTPAHHRTITAIHACRAYSIAVSGCSGGVLVMWDLNRMRYMFTLPSLSDRRDASSSKHRATTDGKAEQKRSRRLETASRVPPEFSSINNIMINEVSGDIVAACGARFGVYDVNGSLLVRLCYDTLQLDPVFPRSQITSLALNRSQTSEWSKEKAVVTGHADGVLCIWAYTQSGNDSTGEEWSIELKGRHAVSTLADASKSAVTAVFLSADERKLYTGTSDGMLSVWTTASKQHLGHLQSS